ncbi:hypothetical protein P167DRAFT_399611 [Morchella conica CCBAS932]|uniref:Uncharacterized protein n=1 Tax=Morchella conica CCBAS932 TaxID=1392247 RepID=A0A3N4KAM2_9PEZI|nr:hypothetical protein P167DRAFT_399611 [Morchella conica CCBAS932]
MHRFQYRAALILPHEAIRSRVVGVLPLALVVGAEHSCPLLYRMPTKTQIYYNSKCPSENDRILPAVPGNLLYRMRNFGICRFVITEGNCKELS